MGDTEHPGHLEDIDDRRLIADAVASAERESALAAEKSAYLAEIERRGLALRLGSSSVARWWAKGLRISEGSAARQVALAQWLQRWPAVHAALRDAEIHLPHASAVAEGLERVVAADHTLSDTDCAAVVEDLLQVARCGTAHTVQRRASVLALSAAADARRRAEDARTGTPGDDDSSDPAAADEDSVTAQPEPDAVCLAEPSGPPPVAPAENSALNRLAVHALPDGRRRVEGNLDALTADKLVSALSPLSAPRPGPAGERDPRSAAKRTADALSDLLDRRPGSGARAGFAGVVDLADLTRHDHAEPARHGPGTSRDDWPFHLTWAGPVSRALALLVTCDAEMTPVVVDGAGVPLALGRSTRTATSSQRAAVTVRDRGCVMCGRPAEWCQVHHLVHWAEGGPTDLDNSALLCGECHRSVHQHGWEIVLGDDRHPRVIPPASIDPDRRPLLAYHRQRRRRAG